MFSMDLTLTLHNLLGEEADFEIRGDVATEEEFMNRVKIDGASPTIPWSEVQASMEELKAQLSMKKLREERDLLLHESDRYVLPDYPHSEESRQAWMTYRQQLRDLPATATINPETGALDEWPVKPE